ASWCSGSWRGCSAGCPSMDGGRGDGGSAAGRPAPLPVVVWIMHVALPLLGLWLLIARPALDGVWEDPTGHTWLVGSAAAVSLLLGARVRAQARRNGDPAPARGDSHQHRHLLRAASRSAGRRRL